MSHAGPQLQISRRMSSRSSNSSEPLPPGSPDARAPRCRPRRSPCRARAADSTQPSPDGVRGPVVVVGVGGDRASPWLWSARPRTRSKRCSPRGVPKSPPSSCPCRRATRRRRRRVPGVAHPRPPARAVAPGDDPWVAAAGVDAGVPSRVRGERRALRSRRPRHDLLLRRPIAGLKAFHDLGRELAERRAYPRSPSPGRTRRVRLDGRGSRARAKVGADVLPWWPAAGVYLLVEHGTAAAADLAEVAGRGRRVVGPTVASTPALFSTAQMGQSDHLSASSTTTRSTPPSGSPPPSSSGGRPARSSPLSPPRSTRSCPMRGIVMFPDPAP